MGAIHSRVAKPGTVLAITVLYLIQLWPQCLRIIENVKINIRSQRKELNSGGFLSIELNFNS